MENLKIRVFTGQQTKTVIELAEKLGYKEKYPKSFKLKDGYVCLDGDKDILKVCIDQAGSELSRYKEISIFDLCGITKPQHKEYLDPHNNYELIEWDGGFMIQDHWIAVPDGAEIYVVDNKVKEGRFYKKDDNQLSIFTRESWVKTQYRTDCFYEQMASCGLIISWQRDTQPEAFLTPESVVKCEKHPVGTCIPKGKPNSLENLKERGFIADFSIGSQVADESTAWDKQVGGNHYKQFKIQPMQFALENKLDAAQHNVIKYVMRHADKNGKEDLEKAKHYIDLMIEHYYGNL